LIYLSDPDTIQALEKTNYVGVFLRKPTSSEQGGEGELVKREVPELISDPSELHQVGMLCSVQRTSKSQPNDVLQILEEQKQSESNMEFPKSESFWLTGHRRINLISVDSIGPPVWVTVNHWDPLDYTMNDTITALKNEIISLLQHYASKNAVVRESINLYARLVDFKDPYQLADFAAHLAFGADSGDLQSILEEKDVQLRLQKSIELMMREKQVLDVQQEIHDKAKQTIERAYREHVLQMQLKIVKKELGIEMDDKEVLREKFLNLLNKCSLIPHDVQMEVNRELERLDSLEKNSSEFHVIRNYLDWLCNIPWGNLTPDRFDLGAARRILDHDHFGLDDVKDVFLEYIAVGKLQGSIQGKILCMVGPPGVGKTSIAKSVARALGRKFYRFSVGGLADVSEIKGHRRTYIGAMPGKIVQCLKNVGSMNPLILIDEIDKIGAGWKGDPSHALLEVLDPNQNSSFVDQYLDVPIDISNALFLCTANTLDTIRGPLLDRMEIVRLSGYDFPEKLAIAQQYLIPRSMEESGLMKKVEIQQGSKNPSDEECKEEDTMTPSLPTNTVDTYKPAEGIPESIGIETSAVESIIRWYAREAGVRNLSKYVDKITRKLAFQFVAESQGTGLTEKSKRKSDSWTVTSENLQDYIGKPIFTQDRLYESDRLPNGTVMGLAHTTMGGSTLYIETQAIRRHFNDGTNNVPSGGGKLQVTGQFGDVMKESSSIAYTVARSQLSRIDPNNTFFDSNDIHLHVPEGATQKDGPSAGIAMVTSLLSLAMGIPVRSSVAMTGEISLNGKVMPVGGIREKAMAAKRAGIQHLILPQANQRDWEDQPSYIKDEIKVQYADEYDTVLQYVLGQDNETEEEGMIVKQ